VLAALRPTHEARRLLLSYGGTRGGIAIHSAPKILVEKSRKGLDNGRKWGYLSRCLYVLLAVLSEFRGAQLQQWVAPFLLRPQATVCDGFCQGRSEPGEEMAKTVRVEKKVFESALRKMISTKPVPLAKISKSKKKLTRIIEPFTPAR